MIKRILKWFCLILVGLFLFFLVIDLVRINISRNETKLNTPEDPHSSEWMKDLSDDLFLSELTLPGTHDSGSQHILFSPFLKCQCSSILAQVQNGYRYLDIRLGVRKDSLCLLHSFAVCKKDGRLLTSPDLTLDAVLTDLYAFLEEHPSETILFCVRKEDENADLQVFQNLLEKTVQENEAVWYLEDRIPKLGEVRGKIVLCTRFPENRGVSKPAAGLSLSWPDQPDGTYQGAPYEEIPLPSDAVLFVQDHYNYDCKDKETVFLLTDQARTAGQNSFCLNFASTTGGGVLGRPKLSAQTLNETVLSTDFGTGSGVILVDFGTEELAKHIYESNR